MIVFAARFAHNRFFVTVLFAAIIVFAAVAMSMVSRPADAVFFDNFANNQSWNDVVGFDGATFVDAGHLVLMSNLKGVYIWSLPSGQFFDDAAIEVEARPISGDAHSIFGAVCRYRAGSFYFGVMDVGGQYGIGIYDEGVVRLLGDGTMRPSRENSIPKTTNHLRFECAGNVLKLYANNDMLLVLDDSIATGGYVGLVVASMDDAVTEIHFDNFSVR